MVEERTRDAIRRVLRARAPDDGEERLDRAARSVERLLERAGGRAVSLDDPDYPPRLRSLAHPPDVVFLSGSWDAAGPVIAMVGAREATEDGRDLARSLAGDLARAGAAVVSGLARGIDAAAHEGAMARGGLSGAVLGTGVERCYPRGHEVLQEALARSLGLMSEVVPGDGPRRSTFASRNRLLAALADAVVIVQGSASSGALLTVEAARSLGRPVGAVPWDPRDPLAAAPHALIRAGSATLVRDAGDVLALCGREAALLALPRRGPAPAPLFAPPPPPEPGPAALVLAALRRRAEPLDDLAQRAGLTTAAAAAALVSLELQGLARRDPGGAYRRVRGA
ncbi:MAG TPA: DNA-processing protein DprA [Candidatus Eisenbacteria bacterium]